MTHPTEVKLPESLEAIRAALPMLPASLLNTIGEYGMARTDRVSELTVQYRWEMLIAGIKDYTAAQLKARDAEIERLRGVLARIDRWELPATGKFWDDEKTRPTSYEAEYGSNGARDYMRALAGQALDQARAEGGKESQ